MKPILIYTLPRTRATAALYAARREKFFNEPFGQHAADEKGKIANAWWHELFTELNDANSAVKIHSSNLSLFPHGRLWYHRVLSLDSHDIFIITRDFDELCWSYLLALNLGFTKIDALDVGQSVAVKEEHIKSLWWSIYSFLVHYPDGHKLITFDNLPESHFDISKQPDWLKPQDSMSKLDRIENFEFAKSKINELWNHFGPEWEAKVK